MRRAVVHDAHAVIESVRYLKLFGNEEPTHFKNLKEFFFGRVTKLLRNVIFVVPIVNRRHILTNNPCR